MNQISMQIQVVDIINVAKTSRGARINFSMHKDGYRTTDKVGYWLVGVGLTHPSVLNRIINIEPHTTIIAWTIKSGSNYSLYEFENISHIPELSIKSIWNKIVKPNNTKGNNTITRQTWNDVIRQVNQLTQVIEQNNVVNNLLEF